MEDATTHKVIYSSVTVKGPREAAFFRAVTDLTCAEKIPLIYLAANSGARLGVAKEVKSCFRVGWSEESNPEHGFQYVYLTPEDYARIGPSVMAHELKLESGETRWVIDTIVGKKDGLRVENLSGSGAIAGAYSRAYKKTFTLTYVTGRTVGIGAYLNRLAMRCIQRLNQPIILTGFSALNKLLGREVYSSHMQLGGPKIMATNGDIHLTVSDNLEGVYVPSHVGGALPIVKPLDPPEREVEYLPENSCDPRAAISGTLDVNGKWLGGIFDKDSFVETLEGWARTVVTGRAKLGGIPVGIVAVETQTVMQIIPADPGQLDSHERVVPQAGQVWFPDSATKTAQAILDFNREELPLSILANWRGFSGGQRDLFEGILQAGSTIVENLRTYKQPIFVYIPMIGELRGGAWVVVVSRINSDHIEMYAERTAKGNDLEPQGMIEIKFRTRELLECMRRLDQQLITLKEKLQEAKSNKAILMVAMASPEDMRINAEHIRIAYQFVEVPGGTNNNNYAIVQLILEFAEITHVDAVCPGWGHASENPELPDALKAKGIVFLGPPAISMAALGDKIGSSLIAQAAEVPTLLWSGSHVKIPSDSSMISIPDEIYRAMIKASWGGGGKGIRKMMMIVIIITVCLVARGEHGHGQPVEGGLFNTTYSPPPPYHTSPPPAILFNSPPPPYYISPPPATSPPRGKKGISGLAKFIIFFFCVICAFIFIYISTRPRRR